MQVAADQNLGVRPFFFLILKAEQTDTKRNDDVGRGGGADYLLAKMIK